MAKANEMKKHVCEGVKTPTAVMSWLSRFGVESIKLSIEMSTMVSNPVKKRCLISRKNRKLLKQQTERIYFITIQNLDYEFTNLHSKRDVFSFHGAKIKTLLKKKKLIVVNRKSGRSVVFVLNVMKCAGKVAICQLPASVAKEKR